MRTARRESLDHLIPISERHLRTVLGEFVDYYNHDRPNEIWSKFLSRCCLITALLSVVLIGTSTALLLGLA